MANSVLQPYKRSPQPAGDLPGSQVRYEDDERRKIQASIETIIRAIKDLQDRVTALETK